MRVNIITELTVLLCVNLSSVISIIIGLTARPMCS